MGISYLLDSVRVPNTGERYIRDPTPSFVMGVGCLSRGGAVYNRGVYTGITVDQPLPLLWISLSSST